VLIGDPRQLTELDAGGTLEDQLGDPDLAVDAAIGSRCRRWNR